VLTDGVLTDGVVIDGVLLTGALVTGVPVTGVPTVPPPAGGVAEPEPPGVEGPSRSALPPEAGTPGAGESEPGPLDPPPETCPGPPAAGSVAGDPPRWLDAGADEGRSDGADDEAWCGPLTGAELVGVCRAPLTPDAGTNRPPEARSTPAVSSRAGVVPARWREIAGRG
jgi:hypothetical protein